MMGVKAQSRPYRLEDLASICLDKMIPTVL